ncbi:ATP-dependent helicase [Helicobacter sp. faydin-H20]|uniref:ATP-dependent helicase n=1 Tax=Helicobacter anatolicus TaxID=2905874 RepID=UPI001E492A0B|nr:ATP-dependent helicase [Helicobacter anatolicus]MCE3036900.1 ATP-dependent helicase [Helicobacter anatolicus]
MPLSILNCEQKLAATAPMGHNLIIASAGTGKTSTIVGRIAYLFENNIAPESILLLTFTNKAAEEMITRVAKKFGEKKAKSIQAGTFHAVAYRYLKDKYDITLKQPRELKILFKSIAEKRVYLDVDSKTPPYTAQYLYDFYSLYLNASKNQNFEAWLEEKSPEHMRYAMIYEGIFDEFRELKESYKYADYNDLLLRYRKEMQENFSPYEEVLCDEYQDTNPLQDSILDALKPKSLFCVGDYDQSIYAFNGADINIIGNFTQKYADAKVFTLTKNYRSSGLILDLANRVIQNNERIYPKSLEVVKTGNFTPPKLLIFDELFLQYQGIAKNIATGNPNLDEVAVIFRNNASGDGCEASLRSFGIPVRRKGGTSFFETKEISLMLDLCSLLNNSKDMMACIHILSYGAMIGNSVAKDIYEGLLVLGDGDIYQGLVNPNDKQPYQNNKKIPQLGLFNDFFMTDQAGRFDEFLESSFKSHPILSYPKFNKESALFLQDFYMVFKNLYRKKDPTTLVTQISKSSFYTRIMEMLAKDRAKKRDGSIDNRRKDEALEQINNKIFILTNLAKKYDYISRFLNAMVLGSSEAVQGKGVSLLSVHASKGLEFEEVYVVDLMEGRFPNQKLANRDGGSIDEERRLFYVAVTRAKTKLTLSYAKTYNNKEKTKNILYEPSRFLYEAGMVDKTL